MVYVIIPFTGLGALITPAMTALMSRRVPADAQGELQGALTGVLGVTLIISPVLMTQIFGPLHERIRYGLPARRALPRSGGC